jgi:hypothetical protein
MKKKSARPDPWHARIGGEAVHSIASELMQLIA